MIEELPDGRSLVYWFTYDPQGRQAWTIGAGTRDGNRLEIPYDLITRGNRTSAAPSILRRYRGSRGAAVVSISPTATAWM